MFSYNEYPIQGKPALFIKKLWTLNNLANASAVTGKSVLPNGCFNIAYINGPGLLVNYQGTEQNLPAGVYFCGQMTQALTVSIRPYSAATMVQLYPWAPVHFTAAGLSTYTDRITPIADIDMNVFRLPVQSEQLPPAQIRRQIVAAFSPLLHFSAAGAFIMKATQLMLDSQGSIAILKIAETLNCTVRYLQKIFKLHIGLSPKELAIIIKLRHAVDDMAYSSADYANLTNLALANQFYDQSHFNNTFQAIVKTSPNKFHVLDYFLSWKK